MIRLLGISGGRERQRADDDEDHDASSSRISRSSRDHRNACEGSVIRSWRRLRNRQNCDVEERLAGFATDFFQDRVALARVGLSWLTLRLRSPVTFGIWPC